MGQLEYLRGKKDCLENRPSLSSDEDYLRGYGEVYERDERTTAHYLMEPIHKELNAMEIEIELMMRAIV